MSTREHCYLSVIALLVASIATSQPVSGQYCGVPGPGGEYLNARYGFEISYAGGWHRLRVGAREDDFEWVCRDTLVVQGTILDLEYVEFGRERTHADSLRRAVTHKAALFCGADGTEGGSYCEAADSAEWVVSASGLPVLEFYQTFVYEDYVEGTSERHVIGPYFAVDISQAGVTQALLLTSGRHRSASEKYADFVRWMVESVRTVESPFLRKKHPISLPIR